MTTVKRKLRLKKKVKRALIIMLIFLLCLISLIIYLKSRPVKEKKEISKPQKTETVKKKEEKEEKSSTTKNKFEETCKKIDYCKENNMNRYVSYFEKNNNLKYEDVVTRVNLNLDYDFYTNAQKAQYLNKDYILVNKYFYLDEDYVPDNLETIPAEYARSGMKLVSSAKDAFVEMARAASKNKTKIIAMSSYRGYKYQVNLYNKYKNSDGEKDADTYSARAGFSEHQTGLCVDIYDGVLDYTNFEKSNSYTWMQENSYKYGFILRYPKGKEDITGYQYESWHYRYVGKEIAKYIHDNNTTYDEYYAQKIDGKY